MTDIIWEIRTKDGGTKILELSANLIKNELGEKIGFRGIARDVTDKFQTQKALEKSERRFRTLLDFVRKPFYEAERGENGSGRKRDGKSKKDLILDVPCGTSVYSDGQLIADLIAPLSQVLVAKGGKGGRGNVHFKSSIRQAPRIAELGEPTESISLQLRLKMIQSYYKQI